MADAVQPPAADTDTAADTATGTADTATGTADTATGTADTATGTADTATGTADTATGTADTGTGTGGAGTGTGGAGSGAGAGAPGEGAARPVRVLTRAPNLSVLYPRALLKRGGGDTLPAGALGLRDVRVEPERLADYARVCGFGLGSALPGTYPHVLAFPLAIALMSEPGFPFPLPGIVHIGNTITQLRPIAPDERLTFEVTAENLRPHRRGRQFDVVTRATVAGEPIWHGTATYLRRGSGTESADSTPDGPAPDGPAGGVASDYVVGGVDGPAPTATWRVPGDIGRAYAAASGDRNPIHLHPLTAKLFGFPRAIAHGMWVKARCLAALGGRLPDAYTVTVEFAKPLLLPSTVDFGARARAHGWDFSVASKGRPHVTGRVAPATESATRRPE